MKKLLITMMALVAVVFGAAARDTYARSADALPAAARQTLAKAFKAKVSLVKIDKEVFSTDYEVILSDGSEVKFDSKGNWRDVEVPRGKSVPDAIVPAGIRQWVKTNHKGADIVGIERHGSGYEIELSDGVDAKFRADGTFHKYD